MNVIKGVTQFYFMCYSWLVIILFIKDFFKSVFPAYSIKSLSFRVSVFRIFCLFCFELSVIFIDL